MDINKVLDIIIEILILINKGIEANKAISSMSIKHDVPEAMIRKFLKV
ncbi:MAG: hypothetical protein ACLR3R_00365 [Clostridium paraputrificum]